MQLTLLLVVQWAGMGKALWTSFSRHCSWHESSVGWRPNSQSSCAEEGQTQSTVSMGRMTSCFQSHLLSDKKSENMRACDSVPSSGSVLSISELLREGILPVACCLPAHCLLSKGKDISNPKPDPVHPDPCLHPKV